MSLFVSKSCVCLVVNSMRLNNMFTRAPNKCLCWEIWCIDVRVTSRGYNIFRTNISRFIYIFLTILDLSLLLAYLEISFSTWTRFIYVVPVVQIVLSTLVRDDLKWTCVSNVELLSWRNISLFNCMSFVCQMECYLDESISWKLSVTSYIGQEQLWIELCY